MNARIAVVFGQFGQLADPVSLPRFRLRLTQAGYETILVEHNDSLKVFNFLHGYAGKCAIVGSSLGAMSSVVFAGYLHPQTVHFVGGFQPSDFDPSGHSVNIPVETEFGPDIITRAIEVPTNVVESVCFRNPRLALTGGLGHATFLTPPASDKTNLTTICRLDVHPGDFPPAADQMFDAAIEAMK